MALDQLSLVPAPVVVDAPPADSSSDHHAAAGFHVGVSADESTKVPRLPRWTRQEILVLIQGKKVAENRVRRGRTSGLGFGSSGQVEPKWAAVSSYCKRHGVDRGAVQCRKRWSNLAGDYKKIKEWETQIRDESDSFWVMRNDLRREKKLPGFFDREVYDILDGGGGGGSGGDGDGDDRAGEELLSLGLGGGSVPLNALPVGDGGGGGGDEGDVEPGVEATFDSGRSAGLDDGLFSDFEQSLQDDLVVIKETPPPVNAFPPVTPISGKKYQPFSQAYSAAARGTSYEKQPPSSNPELGSTQERKKRKRDATGDEEGDEAKNVLHTQLIEAMERNGRLLSSHLESQNMNLQLDREERKEHVSSLISVLDKLAGALGRIADKL